jgi:hypothetical protein
MEERLYHATKAVEAAQSATIFFTPWYELLNRWMRGIGFLWQGKTTAVLSALSSLAKANPQWLDIRILLAGLKLEVSLSFNHPELQTQLYEQELRDVFATASTLPFASRQGLANLLQRWHPLAAAYAAVMPDPIFELQSSTQSILQVGESNAVYGSTIAPAHAAELLLRSLGYDLRHRSFTQSRLNGDNRKKRDELLTHEGQVPYWRPTISSITLVYGLVKADHQKPHYRDTAEALVRDYGLIPHTEAVDIDVYQLKTLKNATKKLLCGHITIKGFCNEVLS